MWDGEYGAGGRAPPVVVMLRRRGGGGEEEEEENNEEAAQLTVRVCQPQVQLRLSPPRTPNALSRLVLCGETGLHRIRQWCARKPAVTSRVPVAVVGSLSVHGLLDAANI